MASNLVLIVIPIVAIIFLILLFKCFVLVHEREEVIVERFGKYKKTLLAGVHFIAPFADRIKGYHQSYFVSDLRTGRTTKIQQTKKKISTQSEVIDFPSTSVITSDSANVHLDCILSYKITNTKNMIYSVYNLPLVLSKMLQSYVRNMAASLTVDQIIEDTTSVGTVAGFIDSEVVRWGVHIDFVKVQHVHVPRIDSSFSKQKEAQLNNSKVIIDARAQKQSAVIESEGKRDSDIRSQQGKMQEAIARSRGLSASIINQANAEARTIREIARVVSQQGGDPIRYLLCLKYIETMTFIFGNPKTRIYYYPSPISLIQTLKNMGVNSVFPPKNLLVK
ncbi:hypothetical protein M0811_07526 [Anaeramoeba ignava]|uniref:Band 7 domain-containing protein n=1 Tax=Anaeramoeba ignava TaxID=1746090 RepID=A0A9Q0LMD2_ANAIG|nr:hypothetical protein M0811_07526 [Anaeramoeba ignava]